MLSALALPLGNLHAQTVNATWDGSGGSDADWSTKQNWGGGAGTQLVNSGQYNLTFGGAARLTNTNNLTGLTLDGITFNNTAGAFVLGGNSVTLIASITNNDADLQTINLPITLNATQIFDAASGAISAGGIISGTGGLTKNGSSFDLTLTAADTYQGATTINAGTLTLASSASLTDTSSVTINSGGTLLLEGTSQIVNDAGVTLAGGSLRMAANSTNETVGALTLSSSSIIDFGTLSGTNNMIFADSSAIGWTGTLSVWNWTQGTDHLYFGSVPNSGLISTQLGQITFYSDSGTTSLGTARFGDLNGEVSPVPEPSAVLVGLSLLSLCGYRERRWFLRCPEARRRVFA